MDERWDNDLKKRIKEVFDNYEDTSADEGWRLLREKFPEKQKRRIAVWIWLGSAAALLVLLLGIFWLRTANTTSQHFAGNKVQIKKDTNKGSVQAIARNNSAVDSATNKNQKHAKSKVIPLNTIAKTSTTTTTTNTAKNVNSATLKTETGSKILVKPAIIKPENNLAVSLAAVNSNQNRQAQVSVAQKNTPLSANNNLQKPASTGNNNIAGDGQTDINSLAQTNPVRIDTGTKSKNYLANSLATVDMKQVQAKKMDDMFIKEKLASNQKDDKKIPSSKKLISLGVYAATYFNYAKGSSNQFNLGAGLTADIRLNDNLRISTGLSVGHNSLSYNSQAPALQSATDGAPLAAASFAPISRYLYTASTPQFKSYDANLMGIDVPLNIKYIFDPGKSNTYLLAGLSSGTFINETYTYSYNNPSLYSTNVSQVQNQSTTNSFNGIYIARTLNLAFGTGYLLGRNRLVIEPFLKYPLEGLGTQQLKFGAGGINLKFNFETHKK